MNDSKPIQSLPKTPKQSKKAMWLFIILTIFVLATTAYLGIMWMHEKNNNSSLQQEVTSLNTRLSEKTNTPEIQPLESSSTTSYKAKVGKFTLTLPNQYIFIRQNDGPGEGGDSTIFEIGKKDNTFPNIVDAPFMETFKVTAFPAVSTTFAKWLDSELNKHDASLRKELSSMTIDGANAKVYQLSAFSTQRWVFFEKNNIFYKIELFESDLSLNTLNEVIKGFKFD